MKIFNIIQNPFNLLPPTARACRGGSWESTPTNLHVTFAMFTTQASRCGSDIGFRVVREL